MGDLLIVATAHPGRLQKDYIFGADGLGIIADQVHVRPAPGAPMQPMPRARVRVQELATGRVVWQGESDAGGNYRAEGLHSGGAYIVVGIDPLGRYKAEAAGPVIATADGGRAP